MSEYKPKCKCCGKSNYSPLYDESFIETNEYHSLWPVSDAVIANPFYKQNPEYVVQYKQNCLTRGCGMILIERAVRQGFPRAAKESKPNETKSPSFIEDLGNGVEKHDLLFRVPKPPKERKPSV